MYKIQWKLDHIDKQNYRENIEYKWKFYNVNEKL